MLTLIWNSAVARSDYSVYYGYDYDDKDDDFDDDFDDDYDDHDDINRSSGTLAELEVARSEPEMISSRPGGIDNPHYHFDDGYLQDYNDDGSEDHDVEKNSDKESLTWFLQERKLRCCR